MKTLSLMTMLLGLLFPVGAQAIVGGEVAPRNTYPNVVDFGYCSGVLLTPTVVLSAAHCKHEAHDPKFVSQHNGSGPLEIESCASFPEFDMLGFGSGVDWAVCTLTKPADVKPLAIASGCELDDLEGSDVTLVGFGRDDHGERGVKRFVDVSVNGVSNGEVTAGGDGKAGCHGDSGGPALMRLASGELRVLGIISYSRGGCGKPEHIALAHQASAWIKDITGANTTPCFTPDGWWAPTVNCGHFAPQVGVFGSRSGNVGEWVEESTCGPAFSEFDGTPIEFQGDPALNPGNGKQEPGCSVAPGNSSFLFAILAIAGLIRRRVTSA